MKKFLFLLLSAICIASSFAQNVSPSGAFTYSYKIDVPQGISRLQPSLSLEYNSQSGNGMLGLGWGLSGLPVITRDSSYDINWDENDHFLFNGQRLVPDGTFYRTENESFKKIEFINNSYWLVTKKDGTKIYFGSSDDSLIEVIDRNGAAAVWALNKVEDLFGNYYEVQYYQEHDCLYPETIYSKNKNSISDNPIYAIDFHYESRNDDRLKYFPFESTISRRINEIDIKIGSNIMSRHTISYLELAQTNMSILKEIKRYAQNGEIFNEQINFDYDTNSGVIFTEGSQTRVSSYDYADTNWVDCQTSFMDVDGDGLADWLTYKADDDSNKNRVHVHLNIGGGQFTEEKETRISSWDYSSSGDWEGFETAFIDVNGDGLADWLTYKADDDSNKNRVHVHLNIGNGQFTEGEATRISSWDYSSSGTWDGFQTEFIDVNGDGLADWLTYKADDDSDKNRVHVHLNIGNGQFTEGLATRISSWDFSNSGTWDGFQTEFIDVNGDGLSDWLSYRADDENFGNVNRVHIHLNIGNGQFTQESTTRISSYDYASSGDWEGFETAFVDVDGDGLADWLTYRADNESDGNVNRVHVHLNQYEIVLLRNAMKSISGEIVQVDYNTSIESQNVIKPTVNSYPIIANKSPRMLTTDVIISDGLGGSSTTSYEYYNGKTYMGYPDERANLGFEWVKQTNSDGTSIKTWFNQAKPYQGKISKQESFGSDGNLYNCVEHIYDSEQILAETDDYHAVNFIHETDTYTYNYNGEGGTDGSATTPIETHIEYAEYDDYGNPVKIINYGDTDIAEDNTAQLILYAESSDDYRIAPYMIRTYGYDVDGNGFNPDSISESYDTGLASEKKFLYYDDGNQSPLSLGQLSGGKLYKQIQSSLQSNQTDFPDLEITYSEYDDYGNVTEMTDASGSVQFFL